MFVTRRGRNSIHANVLVMAKPTEQHFEILVVDDNPVEFRLMQEAFEGPGVRNRLHPVGNGDEAIAFLRRGKGFETAPRPDLILLDINMPGKNGLEVLAEIKGDPMLRSIATIMLTGSNDKDHLDKAYTLH